MFTLILRVHIAVAVLSALCFWVPLLLNKGGGAHKKTGFVYVFLLFVTTTTAIALLVLTRHGVPDRPQGSGLPLDYYANQPTLYHALQMFLGYIAFATFSAALTGLQALKRRARAVLLQTSFHSLVVLGGLGAAALGVQHGHWPMIAVGAAGAVLGACSIKIARTQERDLRTRMNGHILGMIASGIGAYSALAIVLANRMAPAFFHSRAGIIVWLAPALIGVPAMLWAMKRYERSPP